MGRRYTSEKYEKDLKIIDIIENRRICLNNVYEDIDRKIIFLKSIGIKNLRVGKNTDKRSFIPLEDCDDARISEVVSTYYKTAKKRVEEYKRGERKIMKEIKDSLEEKIKQEPEQLELNLNFGLHDFE